VAAPILDEDGVALLDEDGATILDESTLSIAALVQQVGVLTPGQVG
jgi:hypothetical protein